MLLATQTRRREPTHVLILSTNQWIVIFDVVEEKLERFHLSNQNSFQKVRPKPIINMQETCNDFTRLFQAKFRMARSLEWGIYARISWEPPPWSLLWKWGYFSNGQFQWEEKQLTDFFNSWISSKKRKKKKARQESQFLRGSPNGALSERAYSLLPKTRQEYKLWSDFSCCNMLINLIHSLYTRSKTHPRLRFEPAITSFSVVICFF